MCVCVGGGGGGWFGQTSALHFLIVIVVKKSLFLKEKVWYCVLLLGVRPNHQNHPWIRPRCVCLILLQTVLGVFDIKEESKRSTKGYL